MPLTERIVSVNELRAILLPLFLNLGLFILCILLFLNLDDLRRLVIGVELDEEHLTLNLRIWVGEEHEAIIKVSHFLLCWHRKLAALRHIVLGLGSLPSPRLGALLRLRGG